MELKSRLAAIIKEVLDTDSGVSVDSLLARYSVTKRTFYYDLEVMNQWLEEKNYGVAKVSNHLLFLITNRRDEIKKELENCPYYYAADERAVFEFFYIALCDKSVNITVFQKLFDVSKNTIASDIRELKDLFEHEEISIFSTSKQGYLLQGEEFAIRKKLGVYFNKLDPYYSNPKEDLKKFLQHTLATLTGKDFDFFEIARCLIKQYEIDISSQLYTGYIEFECAMIMISWIRSLKGNIFSVSVDEKDTLNITKSYASMVKNSNKLRFHGLYIPDNEVYYMTSLLLGIRTALFSSQEQETLFIYHFVDQLIKNFEVIACIQISDKEHLSIRLRSHIRPFYYRLKYGLQEENALCAQVKTMYPEAFDFCKKAIKLIDSDISNMISDDEISYLTVYFVGTQSDKYNFPSDILKKPSVLIISEKGRAESDLLIEQLKEILGTHFKFEATQYNGIKKIDLFTYSLVVTTLKLKKISKELSDKVIYVHPILKEGEYSKMISVLATQGISYKDDQLIQLIIEDVKKNVPVAFNADKLYLDIFKSMRNFKHLQCTQEKNHSFEMLIQNRRYRSIQGEASWEIVLFEGYKGIYGEELALAKLSSENSAMVQTQYVYNITNKIILVYCFDYTLIKEERTAVVISKQELAITEKNRGNIFVFFACQNDYEHFRYLKNLYDYCIALSEEDIQHMIT